MASEKLDPTYHVIYKRYHQQAEAGHIKSMYRLGLLLSSSLSPDYPEAINWMERASKNGSLPATNWLIRLFETQENSEKLHSYLERAIIQGQIESAYRLGIYYETGQTGRKDIVLAIRYYKMAIAHDNVAAMRQLALIYIRGESGYKNLEKAKELLALAIKKQDKQATKIMNLIE